MALKKSARQLATLIDNLDGEIFDRKKYPIIVIIKEGPDPEGKEGGLACYLSTRIDFNNGFSCITNEAYYVYDSELKDLEENRFILSVAVHEIRHRAQEHNLRISFYLWQKIKKIIFNKHFRSLFLFKKAIQLAWKLRKDPKEADAYFTHYLLMRLTGDKSEDLIRLVLF